MIDVLPAVIGILIALAIIGFDTRRNGAKIRALIASDQAILASLPVGSPAAVQLSARIQATTTLYATGQVLPRDRRPAAIQSALIGLVMVVVGITTWQNYTQPGDVPFAALMEGFFGTVLYKALSVLRRANAAHAAAKEREKASARPAEPSGTPAQTTTISAVTTVEVARAATEVWEFIEDPASQVLLSDEVCPGFACRADRLGSGRCGPSSAKRRTADCVDR